ncbi:hypothetical protein BCR34DRAFT_508340 [Clohesyomyces aquaticus]|uniref:Allergen n=1 Tax=Clohesyomyces aquaticus TaxID=1231657 RepID=A0A1Y1ZZX4_9PLEO|nr:hypothetical protein BCR34DRAFT_508340 [Clohesyomyces aquaticus]
MDKAKATISGFMAKSGHHDTTVHESVAPAVQKETVKPHVHEELTTAVDKEVHQDHYHRTVQPVKDREVLPEKHEHNLVGVEHRNIDHRDHETTKRALAAEHGQFRDERVVTDTTHTKAAAPTIAGEHVHHHIHETIQPVIHKETIQPEVVHTTVPIHETHHIAAKHHQTSELPPVDINTFKQKGGVLGGREERYDAFEGEPKHIGGALSGLKPGHSKHDSGMSADVNSRQNPLHGDFDPLDGKHGDHHHNTTGVTGATGVAASTGAGTLGNRDHDRTGLNDRTGLKDSQHHAGETTKTKPSLLDKLNPMKDTDHDGKKGFMD